MPNVAILPLSAAPPNATKELTHKVDPSQLSDMSTLWVTLLKALFSSLFYRVLWGEEHQIQIHSGSGPSLIRSMNNLVAAELPVQLKGGSHRLATAGHNWQHLDTPGASSSQPDVRFYDFCHISDLTTPPFLNDLYSRCVWAPSGLRTEKPNSILRQCGV